MKLNSASVRNASKVSPIWIIPIVALLIAAWLAFRSWQAQGTEIEILFDSASGIAVGATQIRLKDVPVGKVTKVRLSSDLSKVRVVAMLDRQVSDHLSENSRFWLVEPSISASGISNLGTLISGVFIVMDPGEPGRFDTSFEGLSEPPPIRSDDKGTSYTLQAETLGSLGLGSPIYYRELKVGEVTGYKLSDDGARVDVMFFIESPHDQRVLTKSHFWNVSGFKINIGADGVKAQMASLTSLVSGGIAFGNTVGFEPPNKAEAGHKFYLYDDRDSVLEQRYTLKYFYRLKFSHSVKGLSIGAPVEFRGIKVGEVMNVVLDSVGNTPESLHVFISMEPERLDAAKRPTREQFDDLIGKLVGQGMKATMKTASLITGAKYIDLNFPSGAEVGQIFIGDKFTQIPTQDTSANDLEQQLSGIAQKISAIPIEKIGADMSAAVESLSGVLNTLQENKTAEKLDRILAGVDVELEGTLHEAQNALKGLTQAMESVDSTFAVDSRAQYELVEMMESMNATVKSLNILVDKLNNKPDALIFGD